VQKGEAVKGRFLDQIREREWLLEKIVEKMEVGLMYEVRIHTHMGIIFLDQEIVLEGGVLR